MKREIIRSKTAAITAGIAALALLATACGSCRPAREAPREPSIPVRRCRAAPSSTAPTANPPASIRTTSATCPRPTSPGSISTRSSPSSLTAGGAVAGQLVDDLEGRARVHVQPQAGRQVHRRHAVQRRRSQGQLRPDTRPRTQSATTPATSSRTTSRSRSINDDTVAINLKAPYSALLDVLAQAFFGMESRRRWPAG